MAEVYVIEVWEDLTIERYDAFDIMCVRACVFGGAGVRECLCV